MVKRLRRRPLKAQSGVRFSLGSPDKSCLKFEATFLFARNTKRGCFLKHPLSIIDSHSYQRLSRSSISLSRSSSISIFSSSFFFSIFLATFAGRKACASPTEGFCRYPFLTTVSCFVSVSSSFFFLKISLMKSGTGIKFLQISTKSIRFLERAL